MVPKGLLPSGHSLTAFIAGGWAACPGLASDMDIWVFYDGDENRLEAVRKTMLAHLNDTADEFYEEAAQTLSFLGSGPDGYNNRHVLKVGHGVWRPATKIDGPVKIHVMVTNLPAEDLVETFDISTHAVAIDDDGRVVKGLGWGPITEPPVILRMTPTTPKRFVKIATRYGHPVDSDILAAADDKESNAQV